MLVNIEKLTVDIELNDGARGCGQTGFALNFLFIFLGEICLDLSAKRIEIFAELFPQKRHAYGESLLRRLAALAKPKAESVLAEAPINQNLK